MKLSSNEIREIFLSYFEEKGHKRIRSSSLIPLDDPTLLFTNAGMNQFKDVFVGNVARPANSATTSQKCMRVSGKHNDLGNVGRTARHHTFFEMLGNFSFGDYFKREAIRFAWELITERFPFDQSKLWITVYEEDDESFDIWTREMGMPAERVVRMGAKDNFWSMGDTGPCGPCSEIHFDQGEGPGGIWKNEDIYSDSDRFLEFWNLVFMQYNRNAKGELSDLPSPSVDTGGGLERFASILQGVYSNYECDLFVPIIGKAAELAGIEYGNNADNDVSLQVIADHARATTFLIGDGMLPSNEHRGYVLRRIMRRAIRHGNRLGLDRVFMPDICELVISTMGEVYPELTRNRDFILNVAREEEKSFRRTLNTGLEILGDQIKRIEADGKDKLSGKVAFKLYDTYGFPLDLTEVIAAEHGKGIDHKGFDKEMEAQRQRGKASWKGAGAGEDLTPLYSELLENLGAPVEFTGYEKDDDTATIKAILAAGRKLEEAPEGVDVEIVVERSPFYAESGGQIGDRGLIIESSESTVETSLLIDTVLDGRETDLPGTCCVLILDTKRPIEGLVVHSGRVLKGKLKQGSSVKMHVDSNRRNSSRANHSATHILQWALREVLGNHVKQSGSWVGADRLRFDFTHFQAIDQDQLAEIERLVNGKIRENAEVSTEVKSLEQAQKDGAIAFFGEKYGEVVRVVSMTDDSVELCGGTHVLRTGDIGLFTILHESSIASGIRRIEATTGKSAIEHIQSELAALREAAGMLSMSATQVPDGIRGLFEQQRADRKRIEQLLKEKAKLESGSLMEKAEEIGGIKVLCTEVRDVDPKAFRDYGQQVLDKLGSGMIFLAAAAGKKVNFILGVSEEYRKTFPAGKIISEVAAIAGARGGGRPELAQAGGGDPAKVEAAFDALKDKIRNA